MNSTAKKLPETLNGLPLSELSQIPKNLSEAPEQAILSFETRTRWLGGMHNRSQVDAWEAGGQRIERHHTVDCDEPVEVLGSDTAANPQELLFSAIGSCLSAVYAIHAATMGIELRSLEVEVRGTLDMRGVLQLANVPPGCPELNVRVHVDADATPQQLSTLHEIALRTSPNYYHLTHPIPVRAQLVIKS